MKVLLIGKSLENALIRVFDSNLKRLGFEIYNDIEMIVKNVQECEKGCEDVD